MKDNFADLEEPKSKGPMIVLVAFGLMGIVFAYRLLSSPSHPIEGVVESFEYASTTNAAGAGTENASVRLTDGSVLRAQIANRSSLHIGDKVRIMEQPPSATGLAYQAIAMGHGTEP